MFVSSISSISLGFDDVLIEIDDINVFEKGFNNDLNNNLPVAKKIM
jgi:hypothetical protein